MNYKQIYNNIINYRLDNPYSGYTESHHILPRSLGGTDDKSNLVNLTAREHYICHLLLTKIYLKGSSEYYKMVKAYNLMAKAKSYSQHRNYKVNVNLYENLRIELSKSLSLSQSGEGNSQYGTFWVYNPNTLECKKVSCDYKFESGWFKGRVTNWNTHFTQRNCIVCGKKGVLKTKNSKTCTNECSKKLMVETRSNSGVNTYIFKYKCFDIILHKNVVITVDEIDKFVDCYKITRSIPKSINAMGKIVTSYRYNLARNIIDVLNL